MPQNKNLTQICFSTGGLGKQNEVIHANEKIAYSKCVCLSNDEDGVAEWIKENLF
jgi:hydroxymethylpyrimidine pyrophosphatase-like HAD family hydrolase